MLHSLFVPHIVATVPQNWLGLGHAAFVQKSWLDCGKSLLHTKQGSQHVFFAAMLHSQFVPHIVATVPQNWLGLGHAAFVQKSWLDCGKSLLHTKQGSHHMFFAAMLHSQFVPHIVATMLQNWLGLGHAAFVQKSWLDCGKSLLHTKLGPHHMFFAAMLHSQFVPHIVVTMLQNWLGLGHAAFVQKSWLDCGKSLLHTKQGSHHVFFAAMLHSLFVPHIVATVPQNWLGLGHAAFVQKSWLDCGKSLLHTKLGSHHVFFAAMLHSLFVPHIVATVPKTGSVLAMQPLCRSHGWTVVNHYYTQNWGLTMCFLRQCCTHSLCPTLWPLCPKTGSVLAMQPLCRSHSWTVVNHYYTQNSGLTMCFLRQCCTHCLCPTLWPLCPKPGSVLAMQPLCRSHGWTVVNHFCTQNSGLSMCFSRQCCTHCLCPTLWSLCPKTGSVLAMQPLCRSHSWTVVNHYYTQNSGLTMCFLRQCCTHCLCPTLWPLCPKTGSVLAMQPLCRSHGWTVVNHYYTQNRGLSMCFLRQCCTHSLCPTLWPQCSKTGSVLAMQPLCRSHGWTVVNHYYTQNWGLTICFLRQCCTHSLCPTLWSQCSKTGSVLAMQPLCRSHGWTVVNHYYTQNRGLTMCFLRQCCTHCLCPTLWPLCPKTGSVLAMQPLCRSHGWTVVNHYCTQNWGLTMCFLRQCCTHCLCPTLWPQCSKTGSMPCSLCAEVMVGLW